MRKNPGVYNDLNKPTSDLLTKDFPDKAKLDVKVKQKDASLDISLSRNHDNSFFGSFFPKYRTNFSGRALTIGGSVDTARAAKVEVIVDNIAPGLKVTGTGNLMDESLTVEGEYKRDYLTLVTSANILSPKGTKLEASVVGGHSGAAAGVQVEYFTDKISKINGNLSYSYNDSTANVFARINPQDSSSTLGLSYFQAHSRGSVGAECTLDPAKPNPKITVGGSYALEDKSVVKAKVDTLGRVGLSYSYKLNPHTRIVVGSSINAQNLSSAGNHTLGFQLNFD